MAEMYWRGKFELEVENCRVSTLCQGFIQDYQLLILWEEEIRYITVLYVHSRNSREGKSTSGVGNPCVPHPLNKSLLCDEA